MTSPVTIENPESPIADVRLNRPDKKNAFNMDMLTGLTDAADQLGNSSGLRAVVMSGAGGCFSAGLDVSMFAEFAQQLDTLKTEIRNPPDGQIANRFQAPVVCWQKLPVPVIAAIEGVCYGAGMQLALAADFRIAAPDAVFSIMEIKWGLIPDMGITQSLPKLVCADQAKDLIMTARIVQADETLALGLITRIADDPIAAAHKYALELAGRSPDALARAKQLVDDGWTASARDGLALEAELQAQIIGGANQMEAVFANMQKRAPKYR